MLDKIIEDIEKALDADAYLSALALMMTIPDICAKAEYGDSLRNKERYIKWFEEYIGKYNKDSDDDVSMPYFSGEIAYQLRCSILHEGSSNIDKSKIKEETNRIDSFALLVEKKNQYEIYCDSSCIATDSYGKSKRSYEVNIRRLWVQIRESSLHYYLKNKEKFNFLNIRIANMDDRIATLERIHWL